MPRLALLLPLFFLAACSDDAGAPDLADRDSVAVTAQPDRPAQPSRALEPGEKRRILVVGNSIADGYRLNRSQSFPSLIQQKIDSAGLPFQIDNQGVSGQTTAGGLNGLEWHLERPVDVLLLELGANDGLRGQPVANIRTNLTAIIERVRQSNPDAAVVLTGHADAAFVRSAVHVGLPRRFPDRRARAGRRHRPVSTRRRCRYPAPQPGRWCPSNGRRPADRRPNGVADVGASPPRTRRVVTSGASVRMLTLSSPHVT